MRSKHSTILLSLSLLVIILASCKPDLSGLEKRLSDLESWRAKTEQAIKTANEEIRSLRQLIVAEQKKVSVTSYTELADKTGYELTMSDGSKIVLRHGSSVSVKADTDGVLYWAIGEEFITTGSEGKKIKAEAHDGAPGVTPLLRVDAEGNWEVSTDAGKSFTAVRTESGEPIPAKVVEKVVEKEKTDLRITEEGGVVSIVYKGQTFEFAGKKFVHPFASVAEYDLNLDGTGFATDHANTSVGHFNWYLASGTQEATHNPDGKSIAAAPAFEGYHVPTYYELGLIAPPSTIDSDERMKMDLQEKIMIGGKIIDFTGDYIVFRAMTEAYAIRFKGQGDKYRAAYRYQRVKNPTITDTTNDKGWLYVITVRPLGPEGANVTVADIRTAEYWETNNENDIVRYFPAGGYTESRAPQTIKSLGDKGYFWTAVSQCDVPEAKMDGEQICYDAYAIGFKFFERHLDATWNAYDDRTDGYAIRLFKD